MIDDIYIFDNIIDSKAQRKIQQIIFNKIRWQFIPDVTKPDNKQQRPGFNYKFISNRENVFKWHKEMCTIIDAACNKINFIRKDCLQGRSFLQLPLNLKDRSIDAPHVDADIDHMVVLYYVNDSDGDTVIYENLFEGYDKVPLMSELKESKRVTPKAGRVVMFNGKHWHTSCQPQHNVRCVVNYNVI
tara:strand:- start:55 stop:615 length:561 start_codon:yes stop_codon:yes gene_type:complete